MTEKKRIWSRRSMLAFFGVSGLSLLPKPIAAQSIPQKSDAGLSGKKVLIFGDSITDTKGDKVSWVHFAMEALGNPVWVNYADSGAAFRQRNLNGIDDMPTQLQQSAHETNVDTVIVALGTNEYHRPAPPLGNNTPIVGSFDSAMGKKIAELSINDTMYDAIRYAFYTIQQRWNCKCYVLLPIQRAKWNWKHVSVLYQVLEEMATSYGFEVIDGRKCGIISDFEVVGGKGRDLRDGLHPKGDGAHKKIASMVVTSVRNTFVIY